MKQGLCADCIHQRTTRNKRGSTFSMCRLGQTDPDFKKYPPLPVLSCKGYAPKSPERDGKEEEPLDATGVIW